MNILGKTNSEYVIRDYKPCIEFWTKRCTNPKSIIYQLSSALRTSQVVIHKIKDLTDEQIQNMINDNINALSYLNAYIGSSATFNFRYNEYLLHGPIIHPKFFNHPTYTFLVPFTFTAKGGAFFLIDYSKIV